MSVKEENTGITEKEERSTRKNDKEGEKKSLTKKNEGLKKK